MARLLPALAVLALAASGCVTSSNIPLPPGAGSARDADGLALLEAALVNDHDHIDPYAHPGAAWRMRDVFATNLPTDAAALSPASEFIIHGHYAYISLFHPSAGMVILDLSDPARPQQVGRFDTGTA
ncbi:MAG TPA: hypothetical protein VGR28_14405, partial [Candidatus Thermoplasmatota archaeon]|nr:hypothetical protein [Candidatus Thermoplasmatota archaeon]